MHKIWVNYNNSLTWIKAIWGWFPLLTMIPVSQWGRYTVIYPDKISQFSHPRSPASYLTCPTPICCCRFRSAQLSSGASQAQRRCRVVKAPPVAAGAASAARRKVQRWWRVLGWKTMGFYHGKTCEKWVKIIKNMERSPSDEAGFVWFGSDLKKNLRKQSEKKHGLVCARGKLCFERKMWQT